MADEPTLSLRRGRRTVPAYVMAAVVVVAMAAYGIWLAANRPAPPRPDTFDTSAVTRLLTVTTVYMIRSEAGSPDRLWFATAEGIRVLDTRTLVWRRYGLDHGLPSEYVYDICFDGRTPWVATDAGVARLDSATGRFTPVAIASRNRPLRALAVVSLPGQGVFFSGDSAGFFRVANGDSVARPLRIPPIAPTASCACLRAIDGRLYAGMVGRTVVRYDPATGQSSQIVFVGNRAFGGTIVWDMVRFGDQLYIGMSDDGVWCGRLGSDTVTELHDFPGKGAFAFAVEQDGLWCGTPYGLWRYYSENGAWVHFVHPQQWEITDFQVFSLARTDTYLWYGSGKQGAGYFNKNQVSWQRMRAGLSESNVAALAVVDSALWVGFGYRGGYLDRFDAADLQYRRNYGNPDGVADPNIQCLYGRDGRLYYGGFAGFGYIDMRNYRVRYFDHARGLPCPDVAAIAPDGPSGLLLAAQGGIVRYDVSAETFSMVSGTQGRRITCLLPENGTLWYGTLGQGMFGIDRTGSAVRGPYLRGSMRIVAIAAVAARGREALFVATKENGCHLVDRKTGKSEAVGVPDSVAPLRFAAHGSQIMAARQIDSMLWLGTRERGCAVYEPRSGEWLRFTRPDGLVSDEVRALYDDSAYIWVGCSGGLTRIDKKYFRTFASRSAGKKKG